MITDSTNPEIKIGIDTTVLAYNKEGIGNYLKGTILGLQANIDKLRNLKINFVLIGSKQVLAQQLPIENLDFEILDLEQSGFLNNQSGQSGFKSVFQLGIVARQQQLDYMFTAHNHLLPFFFPKTIWQIHDILPLTHPEYFDTRKSFTERLYKFFFSRSVRVSPLLISTSDYVKTEIVNYFQINDSKVHSIGGGIGLGMDESLLKSNWNEQAFNVPTVFKNDPNHSETEILEKYGLQSDQFFLSLGTLSPRKNFSELITGFACHLLEKPDSKFKLAIAGKKGWSYQQIFQRLAELKIKYPELKLDKNIKFLEFVPSHDLEVLIKHAHTLVYISLEEGFAIPPLEALNLGTPVLLSDNQVFQEVFKKSTMFVNLNAPRNEQNANLQLVSAMNKYAHTDKYKLYPSENFLHQLFSVYNWKTTSLKLIFAIDTLRNE